MRVCFVNAFYDSGMTSGTEVVDRIYTIREFAGNVRELGHIVDVVHLFHRDETIVRNGVTYHFVRAGAIPSRIARLIARFRSKSTEMHYLPGTRMLPVIRSLQPDMIHFFGLTLDVNLWLVSRTARRMGVPLIAHYNSGMPARNRLRRALQRRNLERIDRYLFTTEQHARIWIEDGLPLDPERVIPFMETSSIFRLKSREQARSATGMTGNPVFLWTGRLHPVKDPLVALKAFERIIQCWPEAQFYLYYLTDELLPELKAFVDHRPHLMHAVHFRGRAPYREMEDIYNSADFFVQASHWEASGCAPLEAMSCGAIPVITDIPSFKAMAADSRYGVMFPIGDDEELARKVLSIDRREIPNLSREVYNWWEGSLSFPVLARQLDQIYRTVASRER
jgi:glycosyltransferase involved in cell wall biosynthesis